MNDKTNQSNLNRFGTGGVSIRTPSEIDTRIGQDAEMNSSNASFRKQQSSQKSDVPDERETKRGVIYARVSSRPQTESNSMDNQVARLKQLAERRNISLVHEEIRDEAEPGTDFDRTGIRFVAELASQRKIDYLLADHVDRIGRDLIGNMFYMSRIREYGVTVVTHGAGKLDLTEETGLVQTTIRALYAQIDNINRSNGAWFGQVNNFVGGKWNSVYPVIPFGYEVIDDNDEDTWIEVNPKQAEVFERVVNFFLGTHNKHAYQRTVDEFNLQKHGVDANRLSELLSRPTYMGRPTVSPDRNSLLTNTRDPVTVEDSTLQIISEAKFCELQQKIEEIREFHSSNDSSAQASGQSSVLNVETLVDMFGIPLVEESLPHFEIRCIEPDCGGLMVKDGTDPPREGMNRRVQKYQCVSCGIHRTIPSKSHMADIHDNHDGS